MEPYFKAEILNIKVHPELTEKWVQKLIADDPSIIGLGDLALRHQERSQPRGGRLDLLLQDLETQRRFEVELQLGPTDESHIIRTIEYWDIERKRYPQYEHCAVLIAEEITSRFLNVMALFNGTIPFVAIQMRALRVDGKLSLVFTRVMDELRRGLVDEDEDEIVAPADRPYWTEKVGKDSLEIIDGLLELARKCAPDLSLKYNKHYIGIQKDGLANHFIWFRPQKQRVQLNIKLPKTIDVDTQIETAGLDNLEYNARSQLYRLRISSQDVSAKDAALVSLIKLAYQRRLGSPLE